VHFRGDLKNVLTLVSANTWLNLQVPSIILANEQALIDPFRPSLLCGVIGIAVAQKTLAYYALIKT